MYPTIRQMRSRPEKIISSLRLYKTILSTAKKIVLSSSTLATRIGRYWPFSDIKYVICITQDKMHTYNYEGVLISP